MLVTSIFSNSHNVVYPIKDRNHHLSFIYSVVCKCFPFGHVQNFVVCYRVKAKFVISKCFQFSQIQNIVVWLPFPKPQILDSSELKEFADDSFNFEGNGRKFSKRVKNTVGKEEIVQTERVCTRQF